MRKARALIISDLLEHGGGRARVVLEDGSLAEVEGRRIVYSEETAHLYEQAEDIRYRYEGGLALKPEVVKGWRTYHFEVEDYHTYIAGGVRVHNDSYIVKAGDTLSKIAGQFETTVGALAAANSIKDINKIYVNQDIHVPGSGATSSQGGYTYTIKSGDTLSEIAPEKHTTVSAILAANQSITNANLLEARRERD